MIYVFINHQCIPPTSSYWLERRHRHATCARCFLDFFSWLLAITLSIDENSNNRWFPNKKIGKTVQFSTFFWVGMMKRRGRYCGSSLERHGAHINECLFVYLPSAHSPFNHDHSIFHPPPSYIPHARPAKRKSRLVTYALRCRSLSPWCIIFFVVFSAQVNAIAQTERTLSVNAFAWIPCIW